MKNNNPTTYSLFSKNGQILPASEAVVSLFNIEYSYGYGVYETLKVRKGILYFVDQHLERFAHSANVLEIPLPFPPSKIKQFLSDLIKAISVKSCNIKMLLIGGNEPTVYIFASAPLYPDRKLYKQGCQLLSYEYERLFPTAKTLNMLPSYIAYKKAKQQGCYDALLTDHQSIVLEGTRTNFYLVKDLTIFHAPSKRILEGVTFLSLLNVAKNQGFSFVEKETRLSEILDHDGAFITSTSSKIIPVRNVDTFSFNAIPNSITKLIKAYDQFLNTCNGILPPL